MIRYNAAGQFEISIGPGVEMSSYSSLHPQAHGFVNADALAVAAAFVSFRNGALTQFATTRCAAVWPLLEEVTYEMSLMARRDLHDEQHRQDLQNLAEFTRWIVNEVREFQGNRES
jgi:hypothetical protein